MKFFKSLLAGIFIGLGGTAFLISNNPFMFTIGIFLVFNFNALLITGYIPLSTYKNKLSIKDVLQIGLGNLIGAYCFGVLINYSRIINNIEPIADNLIKTKCNDNLISIFIMSILCAVLIGYGVIGASKNNRYISKMFALLFPTYIFVVCGFEHMVANMFYISISTNSLISSISFLGASIIGNIVGGILIGLIQRYIEKQ